MAQQDKRISEAINRDHTKLRNFIRSRVPDQGDAEDILQDVFYELVEAYQMMKPVDGQFTATFVQRNGDKPHVKMSAHDHQPSQACLLC